MFPGIISNVEHVVISDTASAILNNLAVKLKYNTVESLAIIHQDTVHIFSYDSYISKLNKRIECAKYTPKNHVYVTQVAWCHFCNETNIVVTSSVGLQVFSQSGEECIFSHSCSDSYEEGTLRFSRGIAQFNATYFCIGNSVGCIRMFGRPTTENEIMFVDRKHNHKYPIVDLYAYKNFMASADEEGNVILWKLENHELIMKTSIHTISNCTGIIHQKGWIVVTSGSGYIHLYSINEKETSVSLFLSTAIVAHAKTITGKDIIDNKYLLTVSEDSFIKLWLITKQEHKHVIEHLCNIRVKDSILMGGKFLDYKRICITAYDSNVLTCFTLGLDIRTGLKFSNQHESPYQSIV